MEMRNLSYFVYFFFMIAMSSAQFEPNYDESKVPVFRVPDPLTSFDGESISTDELWIQKRRPELLKFFEEQVYGKIPGNLDEYSFKLLEQEDNALDGKARRKQVAITLKKNERTLTFTLLLYLPKTVSGAPIFLAYNFHGNHTIVKDPAIYLSEAWSENNLSLGITDNTLSDASRGARSDRWALEKIISGGFGLATIYYGEVDPDKNDFSDGLHALFYEAGQERPKADEWGSIAAWAYGLSRAMDYIKEDIEIDATKVIVFGHSRLGKAAIWAAATDTRFAGAVSNESGCGGAAMSKRKYGETVAQINLNFPHWFSENFKQYNDKEEELPVDQHELLALVAPRPLYVASAMGDQWADPKGEFLSTHYATPVYSLFEKEGIATDKMPEVEHPIQKTVAYHVRSGDHNVTDYDWEQYIAWAKTFCK